jgi:hypothetical protein
VHLDLSDTGIMIAARFTAWAMMAAKFALVTHIALTIDHRRSWREQLVWFDAFRGHVLASMILVSSGWTVHQFYWWMYEVVRHAQRAELSEWMMRYSLVTLVAYLAVYAGTACIFAGVISKYTARWKTTTSVVIAATFLLGLAHV